MKRSLLSQTALCATLAGGTLLAAFAMPSTSWADGGVGGRNDTSIGTAGSDSVDGRGGDGGTGLSVNGGGGGGAGVSGGDGGTSKGAGGRGGASPGASGRDGGSTTTDRSGGGGGGGGAHGIVITDGAINTSVSGGNGGNGGSSTSTRGGGGGAGGYGAVIGGTTTVNAAVSGGRGGNGGDALAFAGSGGSGGHGIVLKPGANLIVNTSVKGGDGGNKGIGKQRNGTFGDGGAGIVGENVTIKLNKGASVIGGRAGDNGKRAEALRLTGDRNVLQINGGSLDGDIGIADGGVLDFASSNGTVANTITGGGGIKKTGPGTLTLTGTNTYTGPTTVDAGTLWVNGSIASSSLTTINSGGTLSGIGTVGNTLINGGTLAPGNPMGTLTVKGDLTLAPNSTYEINVNAATSDRVVVTGTADLGSATIHTIFADDDYIEKRYTVVEAGKLVGKFGTLTTTNLPKNFASSLSYDERHSFLDLTLDFTPDPKPTSPSTQPTSPAPSNPSTPPTQPATTEPTGKDGATSQPAPPAPTTNPPSQPEPAPTLPAAPATEPTPPTPNNPSAPPTQPTTTEPAGKDNATSQPTPLAPTTNPPSQPEPAPAQPTNPSTQPTSPTQPTAPSTQPTSPAPGNPSTPPTPPAPTQPAGKDGAMQPSAPTPTNPAPTAPAQPQPAPPASPTSPAPPADKSSSSQPTTPASPGTSAPAPATPPPATTPTPTPPAAPSQPAPPNASPPAPAAPASAPAPAAPPPPPARGQLTVNQGNVAATLVDHFNVNGRILRAFGTLSPRGLSIVAGETATRTQQATFVAMDLFLVELMDPSRNNRGEPTAAERGLTSAYASLQPPAGIATIDRLSPRARKQPRPLQLWASAYGAVQSNDGNAALGSTATVARAYGGIVGADYRLSPSMLAGVAMSGGGTSFVVNGSGIGRSDLFQLGAFLRHTIGPAYLSAGLAYGWQDVTTDRNVGPDRLRARFNTHTLSARAETGYRFAIADTGLGLTPYLAGRITTLMLPSFAETVQAGPGLFGLDYASRTVTTGRSEAGLHLDTVFAYDDAFVTLRGSAAWVHNFNPDRSLAAGFQALSGTQFTVNGAALTRDAALISASANVKWRNNWSIGVAVESELSPTTRSIAGKGMVRYRW